MRSLTAESTTLSQSAAIECAQGNYQKDKPYGGLHINRSSLPCPSARKLVLATVLFFLFGYVLWPAMDVFD